MNRVIFRRFLVFYFLGAAAILSFAVPRVAVSIVPQQTFVNMVAGDDVDVLVLIPPGYSPENYAPRPKDLVALDGASLYFTIAVPAETSGILPRVQRLFPELEIVPLWQRVDEKIPPREFSPGQRDPHIWLSIPRVQYMLDSIAQELGELVPAKAQAFRENAHKAKQGLDQLDQQIRAMLQPVQNKAFLVFHPSFGYFAQEYGLTMIAIQQEGKDATPKKMAQIIDEARSLGIQVVFYQAEIDSRQSEAIATELGGTTVQLDPLAPDFVENLRTMAQTFVQVLSKEP